MPQIIVLKSVSAYDDDELSQLKTDIEVDYSEVPELAEILLIKLVEDLEREDSETGRTYIKDCLEHMSRFAGERIKMDKLKPT